MDGNRIAAGLVAQCGFSAPNNLGNLYGSTPMSMPGANPGFGMMSHTMYTTPFANALYTKATPSISRSSHNPYAGNSMGSSPHHGVMCQSPVGEHARNLFHRSGTWCEVPLLHRCKPYAKNEGQKCGKRRKTWGEIRVYVSDAQLWYRLGKDNPTVFQNPEDGFVDEVIDIAKRERSRYGIIRGIYGRSI